MILAGLLLGRQLRPADVGRRGVSTVTGEAIREASADRLRIREVASLEPSASAPSSFTARVEPVALGPEDPLADITDTDNAVVCRAEPLGEITVIGPGAGTALAGQGVLSDLINVALRGAGRYVEAPPSS